MKKALATLILIFSFLINTAQITFEKSYGGNGNDSVACVRQTSDGGYVFCGSTNSFGAGDYDVFIVKISPGGRKLWSKTFGGPFADYGNVIQQTSDGGYIIGGSSGSFGFGERNIYLVKINGNGGLVWSKTIGGTGDNDCKDVIQTLDGGFAVTGFSNYSGIKTIYLAKIAADGSGVFEINLASYAEGNSLLETENGFIVHGTRNNPGDPTDYSVLIRTDNTGNTIWAKVNTGGYSCKAGNFVRTDDGGYMLGGNAKNMSTSVSSAYILKTDSLGNAEWGKIYNSGDGASFQKTADNGYVITGTRITAGNKNIHLTKTDINGCPVWVKTFGGNNIDKSAFAIQSSDMGYILAGNTESYGSGGNDFYMIKTNISGKTTCSDNSIIINGDVIWYSSSDIQTIADGFGLSPVIANSSFLSATVNVMTSIICSMPLSGYISPDSVASDNIIEVDEDAANDPDADDSAEPFETKSQSNVLSETFTVFPNPGNGSHLNISMTIEKAEEILITVHDQSGKQSYSQLITTDDNFHGTFTINPSVKLKPGMYLITITSGTRTSIKKWIVN